MNFIFNQQINISAALSIFHILNNPLSIFPERWFLTATVISKKIINTQGAIKDILKLLINKVYSLTLFFLKSQWAKYTNILRKERDTGFTMEDWSHSKTVNSYKSHHTII